MNYSAHFIDWFHDHKAALFSNVPSDARKVAELVKFVGRSEKFLLPEGGQLFQDFKALEAFTDLLSLPYPICVLEFSFEAVEGGVVYGASGLVGGRCKELVLVIDLAQVQFMAEKASGFAIFSICSLQKDNWAVMPVGAHIDPETLEVTDKGRRLSFTPLPFMQDQLEMLGGGYGEKEGLTDLHSAVQAAVQFMVGVNCTNVSKESQLPAAKLNEKRVAKGRQPFDSYWILDITKDQFESNSLGGTHAGPRLHFRRGHIRRLATGGATWVRHTVVGNPERGTVDKSYRMKGQGGEA